MKTSVSISKGAAHPRWAAEREKHRMKFNITMIKRPLFRSAALAFAFACSTVSAPAQMVLRTDPNTLQMQKISQVVYLINNLYVDTINTSQFSDGVIRDMLSRLDPHSYYIPAKELKEQTQELEGNFEGIGVEFNVLRDTIVVVNTIPGGPSEQVGLQPGDRIIQVNGREVTNVKTTDVPGILRGPRGSVVDASIVRPGVKGRLSFRIVRDKIPMHSLDASYLVDPQTGYVKLNRFMTTTAKELREALQKMPGIENLILDLRGNGGGLLDQSIQVASAFLRPGSLVVYTEGRAMPRQDGYTMGPALFGNGRLVVLVDEYSASASEIVAGAIQDWDRGTIVGRRTFGKGLVQQQVGLADGSAVRLTVAKYFTPSGRSIQRPYETGNAEGYYHELIDRYSSGELFASEALLDSVMKSHVYRTLIEKRPVYGGGGITPDVVVPVDTAGYSAYWRSIANHGVLLETVITELDANRKTLLAKYPTFDKFMSGYTVPDALIQRMVKLGETRGVAPDPEGLARSRSSIESQIKALLAGRLWTTTEHFRVYNALLDEDFAAALKVLRGE